MQIGDMATFKLGTSVKSGIIIKINDNTIHVKIKDGSIIKRHLNKHVLTIHDVPGDMNDKIDQDTQFSSIGQA